MRPRSSWGSGFGLLGTTLVFCSSLSRPKVSPVQRRAHGRRVGRVRSRRDPVRSQSNYFLTAPLCRPEGSSKGPKTTVTQAASSVALQRATQGCLKSLRVSRTPQGLGD